jgi:NTP pyrophosphatase (non-canonical NTP hydrolase)
MTCKEIIIDKILDERKSQDEKWGVQNHNSLKWLAILTEEVGEVAELCNKITPKVLCDKKLHKPLYENMEKEVIQCAAVCVAWLEFIERSKS